MAFSELSDERPLHPEIVYPITRRMVRQWCADHGWENDEDFVYELTSHILACDKVWIAAEITRRKNKPPGKGKGRGKSN